MVSVTMLLACGRLGMSSPCCERQRNLSPKPAPVTTVWLAGGALRMVREGRDFRDPTTSPRYVLGQAGRGKRSGHFRTGLLPIVRRCTFDLTRNAVAAADVYSQVVLMATRASLLPRPARRPAPSNRKTSLAMGNTTGKSSNRKSLPGL
jgi:hypothetical protein